MDPLMVVIILALGATCITLLLGLITMSNTSTHQVVSTPLMWARVGFQAFTVVLLIAAIFLRG